MEIVYLWVSEYKNIKNQGFNLSSKYHVTYDINNNKLDIQERNPQPIPNFFGENISNITAIVGENGAGKSTLMELLVLLSNLEKLSYILDNKGYIFLYADNSSKLQLFTNFSEIKHEHNDIVLNLNSILEIKQDIKINFISNEQAYRNFENYANEFSLNNFKK